MMNVDVDGVALRHLSRFPFHQVCLTLGMRHGETDAMYAAKPVAFSGIRIAQQHSYYQRSFVRHLLSLHHRLTVRTELSLYTFLENQPRSEERRVGKECR